MSNQTKRGDIYWANPDPATGSEIAKTRPVLVISNDINNKFATTVSIRPITSATKKIYPFEVLISSGESGLKSTSKIKANQIRTIDKQRIGKNIGELGILKMNEVKAAMLIHLDLEG